MVLLIQLLARILELEIQEATIILLLVKTIGRKNTAIGFITLGKNIAVGNTSGTKNTAVG